VLFQETSHKFCFKKSLDESILKVKVLDKNVANHELLGQATLNLHAAEVYDKNSPQPLEMCNSDGQKVRKVYLSFSRTVQATRTEHGEAGMVQIFRSESDGDRDDASRDDVGVPSWQLRRGCMVSDSSTVSRHSFLPYFPATPEGEEPCKDLTAVHAFPAKLKTSKLQLAARGAQLSVGLTMDSAREKSSQGDEPCMKDAARRLSERRSVLSDFFVTAFARADDDWRTNHCWLSGGFSPPAHRT
jgi:hypothetical protein